MTFALPVFDRSDFLIYEDERLLLEREWEDGSLAITRVRSHRPFLLEDGQNPTTNWFQEEWAAGRLHLECSRSPRQRRPLALDLENGSRKACSAAKVQFVCVHLDRIDCPKSDAAIKRELISLWTPNVEERWGPRPPASTVRKWLNRTVVDNRTINGCAPRNGEGLRTSRLDSEVLKLRTDMAYYYWSEFGVTLADAYAKLVQSVRYLNADRVSHGLKRVKCCSLEWLRIRVRELENRDTYAAKYGARAAERRFSANGLGPITSQVLELCSTDHHTWDNVCAVDEIGDELILVGRPTATAILDYHTGCILAGQLHMTDPSLSNMLDAIKVANRPKLTPTKIGTKFGKNDLLASIYGKPDTLLPDNAWEFTGVSGQDSFLDLGLSVDWARAGEPQDKSVHERLWRFFSLVIARKLPTRVLDPKMMREFGYDPKKVRPVLLSDLRNLFAEAVAFWHLKHYGRVGGPPALMWERAVRKRGGIPVIRDDRKLDQLMGKVEQKTLTTSGVFLFERYYNNRAAVDLLLKHMAGTSPIGRSRRSPQTARVTVKVKYNPADISQVHVYDRTTGDYVALECTDPNYAGLSEKHVDALRACAELRNHAFMTPEDTQLARAMLNDLIREAAPELALRHQRKFAQLVKKGIGGANGVSKVHAPSSYSGMMPVIAHETAMATRSDFGEPPKGPRPSNRKRPAASARKERRKDETERRAFRQLNAESGEQVDAGDWRGLV